MNGDNSIIFYRGEKVFSLIRRTKYGVPNIFHVKWSTHTSHNPWSMKLFFDQFRFFIYTSYCQKQYYILFNIIQKPHSAVWYPSLYIVIFDIYRRYLFTLFNQKWWPMKYYLVLSYLMLNILIKLLLNMKKNIWKSFWIINEFSFLLK